MPLLDYTDLERQKNITVTNPDGRTLANAIADGLLAWSASYCNRTAWDKTTYTDYFSPEDYFDLFYLRVIPVDTTASVTVTTFNESTNDYDAYTLNSTVRVRAETGAVKTPTSLAWGYEAVKIAYTAGYDTLPDDLKQALSELLAQKWDEAFTGGKVTTEIRAIDYLEKYELSGKDLPADVLEVLDSYVLPVVL